MKRIRIIIFAKTPIAGLAKTRLIPAIGKEKSQLLAKGLLYCCLNEVRSLKNNSNLDLTLELCVAPTKQHDIWQKLQLSNDFVITEQAEGDLGDRLAIACKDHINNGESVFLMGTDCPFLTENYLSNAIEKLKHNDCVIGPALDGGYTLLGLNKFDATLFSEILWSSDSVFSSTVNKLTNLGYKFEALEVLSDIDEKQDLSRLPKKLKDIIDL